MKISYEKYKVLSKEEQKIVVSLGIEIEKEMKERAQKVCTLKPYSFIVKTTCLLCGGVETRLFKMIPAGSYLYSKEVLSFETIQEQDEAELNIRAEETKTCKNCNEYLNSLPKQSLIEMIKSLAIHKPAYIKVNRVKN